MNMILMYAGACLGLALAVALLGFAIMSACSGVHWAVIRIEQRGEARQLDFQKNSLRTAAWWFSEDAPTMTLLQDLAEMTQWDARDKWRKARKGQP